MTQTERPDYGAMPSGRACPACSHPERATIDRYLAIGQAPRSIVRRYSALTRKAVTRYRDEGHRAVPRGGA